MYKKIYSLLILIMLCLLITGCHTHFYDEKVVEPTCVTNGYTSHTCICGDSYTDNEVAATGHIFGEWEEVKEATETEKGLMMRKCINCDVSESEETPLKEHTHKYEEKVVAPSCIEKGYTIFTCSCGENYNDKYVNALGHKEEVIEGIEATCTKTGLTEGKKCSVCNEVLVPQTEINVKEHSYGEWIVIKEPTETLQGTKERKCINCDKKETGIVPEIGHTHKHNANVVDPTCKEQGYTIYTCSCGDSYKDKYVNALGHKEITLQGKKATCEEQGLTEGKKCSVCNEVLVAPTEIKPLGHTEVIDTKVDATCTTSGLTEGKHCSVCNKVLVAQTEINALGHSYGEWTITKQPTETTTGLQERTCSVCNEKEEQILPVTGHIHKYNETIIKPTCVDKGYTLYECSCGVSYKDKEVNALGHKEVIDEKVEATCTEKGKTEGKHCSVCNKVLVAQTEINPLGHSYGEWIITKQPTEIEEGLKEKSCSKCNDKIIETLPVISYKDVNVTLNANGGSFGKTVEVESELTITQFLTYDSMNGYTVALTNSSKAIYWYYIALTKTNETNVYEIKQIVYQSANVTVEYDYVIMWFSGLTDTNAKTILDNIYNNANSYIGRKIMLENIPSEPGDANINMKVLGENTDTNVIKDTYKLPCDFPNIVKPGYTLTGWLCSLDNKVYQSYPGYNVSQDVTFTAQWEIISMSDNERLNGTYQDIMKYFETNNKVSKNLNLMTFDEIRLTTITYSSSNQDILSNTGTYNRPYQETKVVFTVVISYESESITFTYEFDVCGYKKLENIASSYIYTNYNLATAEFFDTMDIIYCAFVLIDNNGTFNGSGIKSTNTRYLNYMKQYVLPKAHAQGDWVVVSIGGGGSAYDLAYEEICNSDEKIDTLVNNIIQLINDYGFDGVDIDWEVPDEGTKFTKLMKKLHAAVKKNNPNHLVTAAIGGGKWQPPKYDLPNSKQYMDYINVMTYSMVSGNGQHQSSLYPSSTKFDKENGVGYTLSSCSVDESVKIYKNSFGVEASQLIMGAAFYGIVQTRDSLTGTWKYSKSIAYTNIKQSYLNSSNYDYFYDTNCQVPYLLSKDRLTFVSYDDPTSIKAKCEYIKTKGCAGIMYWQNGQDTTGDLVAAIKEGLSK